MIALDLNSKNKKIACYIKFKRNRSPKIRNLLYINYSLSGSLPLKNSDKYSSVLCVSSEY